ncbi:TMV resistance protein N-like [Abrus precatorius]|uniref:ADP-ribosyl cyclase/cyclic ADP-ribose hydrolase n=1 Tax=Abrus precatorius TaxID=3816 RepID=A0A8B8KHL2_ABRPR|nr:TMV resistance protein N-like [Abrus precatorius]
MPFHITAKLLSWRSFLLLPFRALLGRRSSSHFTPLGDSETAETQGICKYDVFISFRGSDTRNTFVDHLYHHLIRKGIFVFKDDTQLHKGQLISPQLVQAIKNSRVSIVVFSKDYASSSWCLDEMATIAECHQQFKQIVFPVFYDVDPSHVRNQSGVYEDAFVLHTEKYNHDPAKVGLWKRAMTGFGRSVGWDVRNKPEFGEIKKLVQAVIESLGHKFSGFADDLIGIQTRVEALERILKLHSKNDDFRVLGIWGMGGIGKTTHATVLYDKISYQFDACCFIEDVRQIYKDGGAIAVQKQILYQTLDEVNLEEYSPSEISGIIRNRLHNIKVLLVLDNVDQLEQLQEMAIDPKLLHTGSRMVITTRDEHILKVYGANVVYNVPLLNDSDACQLFYKKAFKIDDPTNRHMEMIPKVLKYTERLPLAIRVVGSFLCTRDAIQWRDALDRLRSNPDNKIMNVLQMSFEGLQPEEKEIFLHIACFFNGEKKDYVKRILHACGLHPHIGIPVITEKSLINIRNREIHMHEMLQELGKEIVRQQFPKDPGSWSRLWLYQDFQDVLMTGTGTNKVKAIVVDKKKDIPEYYQLRAEGLSIMRGLIILILYDKNFSGSLNFLSNSLKYLLWHGYPFTSLPLNFEPYHLVELNLPNSNIRQLWQGFKYLPCLKRLDLSKSKYLFETPNFEGCRRLEWLDLTGCTNLLRVHPSIGLLEKLDFLSLEGCSNLASLNIGTEFNLCSLRVLHLSGCVALESTPDFTEFSNLEYLDIDQCMSLALIDQSIGNLTKLKFLSLRDCINVFSIPQSVNSMTSLITLDLCGCLKLEKLPLLGQISVSAELMPSQCLEYLIFLDLGFCNLNIVSNGIGDLMCLERLNLEGNNFVTLPHMGRLSRLAYLNIAHCNNLQVLPALPHATSLGGRYFKTVSGSHNHRSGLYIFDCPFFDYLKQSQDLGFWWLQRLVKNPCHFRCGFDIVIPGNEVPPWFSHQYMGGLSVRVANIMNDQWLGVAFCAAFEKYDHPIMGSSPLFYLSFESEHVEESLYMPLRLDLNKVDGLHSKHLWLIYISRPHCHFVTTGASISFKAQPGLKIKEWGLRMVFEQDVFDPNFIDPVDGFCYDYAHESSSSTGPKIQLPYNWLLTEDVHGSSSNSESKLQLPYNWFVTEEEENETIEVNAKENNLSSMGLSTRQSL